MYKVYAITDIGRKREQNQDGFLVDGMHCENTEHREIYYESDADFIHVALCDGVGSTVYASYAVEKAQEYICNHLKVTNEQELENMIRNMNEFVYDSLRRTQKADGACTVTGIVAVKNTAYTTLETARHLVSGMDIWKNKLRTIRELFCLGNPTSRRESCR